jgi:cyclohexadieny/prephenate dehydrogenase
MTLAATAPAPFAKVSVIGLGLLGGSVARAVRARMPGVHVTGYDASADVRARAAQIDLADTIAQTPREAVAEAGLVISACRSGPWGPPPPRWRPIFPPIA